MISSRAPPCFSLGITIDENETRDTIPTDASIFGAKTWDSKATKISI
jgi:hypothetical protein